MQRFLKRESSVAGIPHVLKCFQLHVIVISHNLGELQQFTNLNGWAIKKVISLMNHHNVRSIIYSGPSVLYNVGPPK